MTCATTAPDAPVEGSTANRIVESTIQRSSQIATLPVVALQIIRLVENPDSTIEDLNRLIVNDPVLGVRILKLVNSAYYGMSGRVKSIKHAILLLGLNAIKNVAIAASLAKLIRGGHINDDFDAGDLWTHSVAVATAAKLLAQKTQFVLGDEAFLAGLIHDMGILIEMQTSGPNFGQMVQKLAVDETLTFRKAEEEFLGASHEMIGAGLCRAWKFPPSLQFVTGYHHRPWEVAEAHRPLTTLVYIADVLAARNGLGYTRTVETDVIDPLLLGEVHLTEADLELIVRELPDAMQESQDILSDGHEIDR